MLIVNKSYHDYYDSVLSLGVDKSIIYNRELNEISIPESSFILEYEKTLPHYTYVWRGDNTFKAIPIIIGVAGKLYLCYKMTNWETFKDTFCYSVGDIILFFRKNNFKEELDNFMEKTKPQTLYITAFKKQFLDHAFTEIQNENVFNYNHFKQIMFDYKVPVISIEFSKNNKRIVLNPNLSMYNFQTVVDPYTCFQEISMWLGGVLGVQEQQTGSISDDRMRDKKGFDKMSFKTYSPGNKKRKQK